MISAVINTYNEGRNIGRCLSSLGFCDERIVVDMGSTDNTLDTAKEFGCRIYSHPYTGFVEPARNFAVGKAKNGWVLVIDADEEVPKALSLSLLELAKKREYDYFRIPRKNIIFSKWIRHSGWWPDYQIRFFQKGKVSWTEKIHGVPLTEGAGFDLPSDPGHAIFHNHYSSLEQYIGRMNRYTSVTAKEMFIANIKFSTSMLFQKPLNEFLSRFFLQKGYRDGIHGLTLALLQSFSEILTLMKLWELEGFRQQKIDLQEVSRELKRESNEKSYWINNVLLQEPHGKFEGTVFRLKRKLRI